MIIFQRLIPTICSQWQDWSLKFKSVRNQYWKKKRKKVGDEIIIKYRQNIFFRGKNKTTQVHQSDIGSIDLGIEGIRRRQEEVRSKQEKNAMIIMMDHHNKKYQTFHETNDSSWLLFVSFRSTFMFSWLSFYYFVFFVFCLFFVSFSCSLWWSLRVVSCFSCIVLCLIPAVI